MGLRESARAVASRCSAEVLCGRYRLDGHIGSGGAADVHRGLDLRLRRPVAVKVFRPDTGFDPEEASHGEAVILARLQHPGLVTAYDVGQHNGRGFLVMQLIEGGTLKKRIAQGPLTPAATAAVGAGLADALAHAHEAGVVHRDVKPSNVLLDASHRPHLTDFGISRLLDATTRTVTGTLVGTAAYLSPEQVLGRPVGRPADVYALGLALLECLTGRLEYDGSPLEAAIARLHRRPVIPSGLPVEFADLLADMTALEERDRPTARDCARTLAAWADPAGLAADPPAPTGNLVPSPAATRSDDRTHPKPSSFGDRTAPRAAPARRRTLVAGVSVTLVTVLATALTVADDSAPQGHDRSATEASGAPTGDVHAPRTKRETEASTPAAATPPSSGHNASDETDRQAPSPSQGSDRASGAGTAAHDSVARGAARGTRVPPSSAGRGPAGKAPGHRPPGQAKKTEQAGDKRPGKRAEPPNARR
ncbi:serine/threonine protein kinase [Streptomyces sp. BK208]|uniref:serine/threonine-protein kinase n=1 Tax=Streptomyces sp. BK208 TaxID=2512150 RepID=UPI0010611CFC|nr:serine/threonine-protein kinase [Streptomyces sp. BK208]TDT29291.1 serine/threonine protein kinase [Streptomyces sp. BK208]